MFAKPRTANETQNHCRDKSKTKTALIVLISNEIQNSENITIFLVGVLYPSFFFFRFPLSFRREAFHPQVQLTGLGERYILPQWVHHRRILVYLERTERVNFCMGCLNTPKQPNLLLVTTFGHRIIHAESSKEDRRDEKSVLSVRHASLNFRNV